MIQALVDTCIQFLTAHADAIVHDQPALFHWNFGILHDPPVGRFADGCQLPTHKANPDHTTDAGMPLQRDDVRWRGVSQGRCYTKIK